MSDYQTWLCMQAYYYLSMTGNFILLTLIHYQTARFRECIEE